MNFGNGRDHNYSTDRWMTLLTGHADRWMTLLTGHADRWMTFIYKGVITLEGSTYIYSGVITLGTKIILHDVQMFLCLLLTRL